MTNSQNLVLFRAAISFDEGLFHCIPYGHHFPMYQIGPIDRYQTIRARNECAMTPNSWLLGTESGLLDQFLRSTRLFP